MLSEEIIGKRVMLIHTSDPYTKLAYGDEGTVTNIDCMGTVFVKWDNGSSLGMVTQAGDRFTIIQTKKEEISND